ncbi:hypothetical protein K488DRAFT_88078 [Vararia minispora EC-137]|uniref:Uncharacterized protein n=1 Tax=Vararia minispora EC-137 TaxID=1314806 RepID=A0ACB8QEN1_9AGAM|nr:hypothetical protein K488DRAFT_88078 [Vararia minispora EC-137]
MRPVVLITGCTTGSIGHALALEFSEKGYHVIATSRSLSTMQDLVARDDIDTLELDVTKADSVAAARTAVAKIVPTGRLNILVNNAGGPDMAMPAVETDIEAARALYDVNVFGAVRMIKAFAPLLLAAAPDAHIVNVGSVSSLMPVPYLSMYSSAKAALAAYTDTLRLELAPFGVKVTLAQTGPTENSTALPDFSPQVAEDSMYRAHLPVFNAAFRKANEGRMPARTYARAFVAGVPRAGSWMWLGQGVFMIWFVSTFVPRVVLGFVVTKVFGFDKLRRE